MTEQHKKREGAPNPLTILKGSDEHMSAEVAHARSEAAATAKNKRESGKDKEKRRKR